MSDTLVIEARGLTKRYGRLLAVDDLSFSVCEGEIFGLIGPNGAGKTTTMECVEGIRRPDGGHVQVLGVDPYKQISALQSRIGVQLQEAELQKRIKVWEVLDLMASLYANPLDGGGAGGAVGSVGEDERAVHESLGGAEAAAVCGAGAD